MTEYQKLEAINKITDALFGLQPQNALNALANFDSRLDISRPNIHDSKKEFLYEKTAIENAIVHTKGILSQFVSAGGVGVDEKANLRSKVKVVLDRAAVEHWKYKRIETATDLTLKTFSETGFFFNTLLTLMDSLSFYEKRLVELGDQERQFWTVSSRPPNYYARAIALRFARIYAAEKQRKPTFGLSSEADHPSTEFGRALEEIFQVLEIKAKVRGPAEWAISQLVEADWIAPDPSLGTGLFGAMLRGDTPKKSYNAIQDITDALMKRSKT